MVMGLTDSPGLARLVLLHNAEQNKADYPEVPEIMDKDTYMDDSGVFGDTADEVVEKSNQVLNCLAIGSFKCGKILTDSKKVLSALPEESLHPALKDALKANNSVDGVIGNKISFAHPNIEDAVVNDAKQLGVHISIDITNEQTFMTYGHWYSPLKSDILTKRTIARRYAMAWNPLHEMGPLTNPGKICLSKVWKLQKYLQRRQIQCRFDFKEKGRYKPLSNQRDAKPKDWFSLQKVWPPLIGTMISEILS